jgi:hypothetical protein
MRATVRAPVESSFMRKPVYQSRNALPVPSFFLSITLVSAIAVLLPYAARLDAGQQLPDALYGFGLWVVAFAALFGRWRLGLGLLPATLAAGVGVPLAVLCKLVWDLAGDPGSHTLWPFELAMASAIGVVPALLGALAGWGLSVLLPVAKS